MRTLTAMLVVLAFAACGRIGLGGNSNDVAIEFRNESTEQATLYVVSTSGEEIRLGTVTAGGTDRLKVSESVALRGTVTFAARLFARSETPNSGPLTIRPGDRYVITLPSTRGTLMVLPGD